MLFNSFEFLIFLPIVFLLYWFVFDYAMRGCKRQLLWQNLLIVVASYVFYGWWDWRFLILIAITTVLSFLSGIGIEKALTQRGKKAVMIANVVVNLGILGVYKYYDFFATQFAELFGIQSDFLLLHLILPVGISFYTFQALSYSIDVYRKQIEPTHDIVSFTAFLSFFPQLVAGPIERATNLLPQFQRKRTFDYTQAVDGMRQILWGLFKKIVIADNSSLSLNGSIASYCNALETVIIGTGVSELPINTLYDCSSLKYVIIRGNVTKIDNSAFWNTPTSRKFLCYDENTAELCMYRSTSFSSRAPILSATHMPVPADIPEKMLIQKVSIVDAALIAPIASEPFGEY